MRDCAAVLRLAAEAAGADAPQLSRPRGRPFRGAGEADGARGVPALRGSGPFRGRPARPLPLDGGGLGSGVKTTALSKTERPPSRDPPPRGGAGWRRPVRARRPRRRLRALAIARRRGQFLVGPVQPAPVGEGRAEPRPRPADLPHRLSRQRGGAGAPFPARPAGRRAVRALRLRRRARQRLRRTDRPGRAAPPLRGGHGAEEPNSMGKAIRSTKISLRRLPYMRETSGAALGFDRLAMLACGADNIEDVQWTPVFRP